MSNSLVVNRPFMVLPTTNPNKTAISYSNESVSYYEFMSGVISLSNELKKLNVNKGDFVAIHMANSIDMVVSIFAIMHCNAIVLPINIDLPEEQVSWIINESKPKVILYSGSSQKSHADATSAPYCVDYRKLINEDAAENDLVVSCDLNDLAYCIFTSGSSGTPKGALLTYEGILNHAEAKINLLKLTSENRLCLSFNIGFVASIWQIITPLILGAQLFIYDNDLIKKPYQFFEQLERDEVNVVSLIPQSLYAYCHYLGDKHKKLPLPEMKHILLTGEKVDKTIVNKFYGEYNHISLANAYGQSECSDDTFHYEIPRDCTSEEIPIGKPVQNISYRILNENLQDAPVGDKGELYIGGVCLAQSYLNNDNLTKEKFVSISDEVFYRTGDIVSLNKNQDIVCLGRADNQIKIRGYLIEPEEVEAHLHQLAGINQAVVFVMESNEIDKILCAYYTSSEPIDSKDISSRLSTKLPAYMIPSVLKRVEHFFQNSNGKVDRKRISECVEVKSDEDGESDTGIADNGEDMTETQKRAFDVIVSNVSEEISVNITLDTDFNNIGFDSITFIKTVVALESEFDFEFDDEKLLISEFPTVKSMVEYVESMAG